MLHLRRLGLQRLDADILLLDSRHEERHEAIVGNALRAHLVRRREHNVRDDGLDLLGEETELLVRGVHGRLLVPVVEDRAESIELLNRTHNLLNVLLEAHIGVAGHEASNNAHGRRKGRRIDGASLNVVRRQGARHTEGLRRRRGARRVEGVDVL